MMPDSTIYLLSAIGILSGIIAIYSLLIKRRLVHPDLLKNPFPDEFRKILDRRVWYYRNLDKPHKEEFETRILKFLSEKRISGVDTQVLDEDSLLVAASAIIPMFTFPYYNYPGVSEILLYPNSFDQEFQTGNEVRGRNILGMV